MLLKLLFSCGCIVVPYRTPDRRAGRIQRSVGGENTKVLFTMTHDMSFNKEYPTEKKEYIYTIYTKNTEFYFGSVQFVGLFQTSWLIGIQVNPTYKVWAGHQKFQIVLTFCFLSLIEREYLFGNSSRFPVDWSWRKFDSTSLGFF